MTLEARVTEVLRRALLLNDAQTTPDAHLIRDLGVSRLDRFELVMGVEDVFGIELSDEEREAIRTVGDVVERVKLRRVPSSGPMIPNR
jgi:acyl carrier protein